MKLLKNKKGMTLIEIMVVLLIMSILLVIMGSLILNSFKYFNETTTQDLSKRSLDSISDYIREELLYASDVRVQEEKPNEEEWNILHVKDGKLYKNEEQVFSDIFYDKNELYINVRGFENYRLDIKYTYKDSDGKQVYSTNDTLELLNLKMKIENESNFDPFSNISNATVINDKVKIYYQKTIKEIEEQPDEPEDVFSSTQCLNGYNNRGLYKAGDNFKTGDMVYHNDVYGGYWYIFVYNDQVNVAGTPLQNLWWKRVSDKYSVYSAYHKDDIIYYLKNNTYYLLNKDLINRWSSVYPDSDEGKVFFKKLADDGTVKSRIACSEIPDDQETVANKLDYDNLNSIQEFVSGKSYQEGEFVKITYDGGYIEYYLKVLESTGKNPPNSNPSSGWQRLTKDWDENSTYKKGDVVLYRRSDNNYYFIEAQQDIEKKVQMTLDTGKMNEEYWKELRKR